MKKDIVKNAVICLSHLEIEDTTYKIARDIVIEEYEQQKIKIEELQKEIVNQDKYIDKLKNEYSKEIERLNNIIKEAREYIESHAVFFEDDITYFVKAVPSELLNILDKENK